MPTFFVNTVAKSKFFSWKAERGINTFSSKTVEDCLVQREFGQGLCAVHNQVVTEQSNIVFIKKNVSKTFWRKRTFKDLSHIYCCHYDKMNEMWMFFFHFTLFYLFVYILGKVSATEHSFWFCCLGCFFVVFFFFFTLPSILFSSFLWRNRKQWSNYRLNNILWEKVVWEIALPTL